MRLLADLAEDDVKWLDARAAELGLSRAAFLGLWGRQGSAVDGLAYERRLRGEPGCESGADA